MAPRLALALLTSLLLAACGGSSPASSSSSSGAGATSTGASATSAGTGTTAGSSTATAVTSTPPPEVPRSKQRHVPHSRPVAPDTGARIPASFTIPAGNGPLTPPLISVPKGITINLRVRNQDSQAHTVQFDAPGRRTIQLAAGQSGSTQVTGLPDATYRLLIDGSTKGRIVVGSVPGP